MAAQPPPAAATGGMDSATLSGIQHQQQMAQGGSQGFQHFFLRGSPIPNVSPNVQKGYWDSAIPGYKTSPLPKLGGGINSRAKPFDLKKGYQAPPGGAGGPPGGGEGAFPQSMSQGALAAIQNNSQGALAGVQNHSQGALAGVQHGGESQTNAQARQASMGAQTTQSAMAAVQNQSQGALAAAQTQTQHMNPQFKHMAQLGFGQNLQPFSGIDPLRQQNVFQSHLYSRMSPFDYMNYAPVTQVFGRGSAASENMQYHNQMIAAQQQSMQAQAARSSGPGRA